MVHGVSTVFASQLISLDIVNAPHNTYQSINLTIGEREGNLRFSFYTSTSYDACNDACRINAHLLEKGFFLRVLIEHNSFPLRAINSLQIIPLIESHQSLLASYYGNHKLIYSGNVGISDDHRLRIKITNRKYISVYFSQLYVELATLTRAARRLVMFKLP